MDGYDWFYHIHAQMYKDTSSKTTVDSRGQGPAHATFGKDRIRQRVGCLNLDKFVSLSGSSQRNR